jgi:hypothetical protein
MNDFMKNIPNPEPWILRAQAKGQVKAGAYKKTLCPHPVSAVDQFVDQEPGRVDRPTNLFQCSICNSFLWLVDPHGTEAKDG